MSKAGEAEEVDEEFNDLPDLEEPGEDVDTDEVTTGSQEDFVIVEGPEPEPEPELEQEPESEPVSSPAEPEEIIEINAPSQERSSIFGTNKVARDTTANDIFGDIVSDHSDNSDAEDEDDTPAPRSSMKIEEISSTRSAPKIEELKVTGQPRSRFLIEDVTSTPSSGGISDMFCTQDSLMSDDVERMVVGEEEEEEPRVRVLGDSFLSRLGHNMEETFITETQGKCLTICSSVECMGVPSCMIGFYFFKNFIKLYLIF